MLEPVWKVLPKCWHPFRRFLRIVGTRLGGSTEMLGPVWEVPPKCWNPFRRFLQNVGTRLPRYSETLASVQEGSLTSHSREDSIFITQDKRISNHPALRRHIRTQFGFRRRGHLSRVLLQLPRQIANLRQCIKTFTINNFFCLPSGSLSATELKS